MESSTPSATAILATCCWAGRSSAAPGQPLSELFNDTLALPLGMERTRFTPPASARRFTAATELDGDQRLEPGLVWGEVHDGNAWALGGMPGTPVFSPVDDLARFASALLAPAGIPCCPPCRSPR